MSEHKLGVGLKQLFLRGKGRSWVLTGVFNMRHGEQSIRIRLLVQKSLRDKVDNWA